MTAIEKLDAALASAFPAVTIDRSTVDEPTALWNIYEARDELADFWGRTWHELPAALLVRHSTLPIYAGDALFRATLPAYLRYLLHEREQFNDLPFQLARQLTRSSDPASQARFDRRIARLTPPQRAAVREVLAHLSTVPPMEDTMSAALPTWNDL